MKNVVLNEIFEFVDDQVLPIFEKEPGLANQILDYDFLLEFSNRRRADPFSLVRQTFEDGLEKVRLFAYVPQCNYHCAYCPFPTLNDGRQEEDAVRLMREAANFRSHIGGLFPEVESFSVGGGTPTVLSANGINRLVSYVREIYQIPAGVYVNMECSPDSISEEKVVAAFDSGVTRLSMGVQTFDDRILEKCRRRHTGAIAEAACRMLLQRTFQDLNVDLMRGLPGQRAEIFTDDIQRFITTGIPSLHLYRLRLPPKHPLLKSEPYTREYVREVLAMQLIADRYLVGAGYQRHHSAHWTNNPHASSVTSKPWDFDKAEIGFGMGAYSYVPMGEARNITSVHKWRKLVDSEVVAFSEGSFYSAQEQEVRWIKFALKSLVLDLDSYKRYLGKPLDQSFVWPKIERLIDLGVLVSNGKELFFTPAGYAIAEEAIRFLI